MTTRKQFLFPLLAAALSAVAFGLSGCATPGPLHLYTLAPGSPATIRDVTATAAVTLPSFLKPDETLVGFAYDPFTDHFFLRLAPGNEIRVVDRPARAVKRAFTVASLPTPSSGDLAIRPRDGHVFVAHPTEPAVIEFNRFGETIRTTKLASIRTPPRGLAYDSALDRLFTLHGGDLAYLTTHDLAGQRLASVSLDREVALSALGYDPTLREFYLLLTREPAVGIFSESGHLLRTLPLTDAAFFDVGPRSFLRLF